MADSTKKIYNKDAQLWQRREPNSLSDFTGRPAVFELCGDVRGKDIIDLGAGEGYCARVLEDKGANSIQGIELSEEMVKLARQQSGDSDVIEYRCGDIISLPYETGSFDLALGMFVYNYLHVDDVYRSFKEVYRVLKANGSFVFSVPHPAFPFIRRELSPPFYFDVKESGYFSSRDQLNEGKIYCLDGQALSVQMIPKLLQDYFDALRQAGFTTLPQIAELGVTDEMLEMEPDFFQDVKDIPLHLALRIDKQA